MNSWTDQALEQCRKTLPVYEDAMPISGNALKLGLEWLESAKRLRLEVPLIPDGLEERKIASLSEYGYGLDAPYPVTVIEYEHGGVYDVRHDYTRALATRRLALCVGISDAIAPPPNASESASQEVTSGSMLVWPITFFDEKKEWEFSPGVVLVPFDQGKKQMALAANQYLALADRADSCLRGLFKASDPSSETPMNVRYQLMMPELCKKLGDEHASKMMKESSLDALWVVLGSFTAMTCANVFINRPNDQRFLVMKDSQGASHGLDPFRGKRSLSWTGKGRWRQTATLLPLAGRSK